MGAPESFPLRPVVDGVDRLRLGTSPPGAGPASKPRTLAGRCGAANWVCVSQCIDITCVEKCLAEGCEEALVSLARCAQRSGCGPDDSACVARVCGKQCERTFEPAPPSPVKETPDPCADPSVGSGKVPGARGADP